MVQLSIIFPHQNQQDAKMVERSLRTLSTIDGVELIIVDENGSKEVLELYDSLNTKVIQCSNTNRAKRLNIGATHAAGELLLLHHPRNVVSRKSVEYLLTQKNIQWGGFKHAFNHHGLLYTLSSWYSNFVRLKGWGTVYLDHCIVVQKKLLTKVGGVPDIDIFEDTALSKKLRRHARPILIPFTSTTSPVRFATNGFIYQWMLNQVMKLGYMVGLTDRQLNNLYEKGLWLNNKQY